jgi:hypothetical protein
LTTSKDGHIKDKLNKIVTEYTPNNEFGYDDLRVKNIHSATTLIKRATIYYYLGIRLLYINVNIGTWLLLGHWGLFGSTISILGIFYFMDHL